MKGFAPLALAAGLLSTPIEAIRLQKRTDGPPRVLGFPVHRKSTPDPVLRDRLRRGSETVQVSLANEQTLYFATASLGTPAQDFHLQLDTGSSDLWVNTPSSTLCKSQGDPCSSTGTYVANSSSTYSYIASDFSISYEDGSSASGDYVSDTFTIGGTTLAELQFGIGYTSTISRGILGIGYQITEVQVGRAGKSPYNNLPAQLVADDKIQSNAYSLWLNDLAASTGNILFGGVDTSQYQGSLETLPVQTVSGEYAELLITLTGITLGSTVIASSQALAVVLDSGSSLTYLPDSMAVAIYEEVGAEYVSSEGAAYVDCSLADNTTTLDFTFSSPTISVAMSELVVPISTGSGSPKFPDGVATCVFGIAPAGSRDLVLGDTFIRSAYIVYDLSNNEISIAQTDFNATTSNIVEIGTGTNAVPDATAVANSVAATGGSQGSDGSGSVNLGSSTSTAGAERTAAPVFGAMAAVGAGVLYAAM